MSNSNRNPAGLVIESLVALILASTVIRTRSRLKLGAALGGKASASRPVAPQTVIVGIRRVIHAWSRHLPWRTLCFEQGLSAHWLLKRRGYQSTLFYGARLVKGELEAHVWVTSGTLSVIGCENAGDFVVLSQFTNASS